MRAALPVLVAGAVALSALLAVELVQNRTVPAASALVATLPAGGTLPGGVAQAPPNRIALVGTILGRPLFNTDRRPVAVAVTEGAGRAVAGLPRLAGILVTPSGRTAIFAGPDGGKPVVVVENGRVGAYVVSRIEGGSVTVTGPDGPRQIRPSFATGAEASAYAAQQAPGQLLGQPLGQPLGQSVSILDLIRNPPNIPIPAAPQK